MRKHSSPHPLAGAAGPLELPRYFPGLLVTADELTQDQRYFRERLRLHNRMLWGWGTVCGALVHRVPAEGDDAEFDPWGVKVTPGYLLGPYGDDIVIGGEVTVDVRGGGVTCTAGQEPAATGDPWCSRVCMPREPGPVVVAVRYRECLTRPVRVQPAGCGCSGEQCEYSRLRDGYEIGILDCCPESHRGEPPDIEPGEGPIPECPPCPDDPWVALAVVELDEDGIVGQPDNCKCRRLVVSLAPYWWRCTDPKSGPEPEPEPQPEPEPVPGPGRPPIDSITWTRPTGEVVTAAPALNRGEQVTVTVTAAPLGADSRIALGPGFEVGEIGFAGGKLTATIKVLESAPAGPHALTVVDANRQVIAERAAAFRVPAGATPGPARPAAAGAAKKPAAKRKKSAHSRKGKGSGGGGGTGGGEAGGGEG